MNSFDEQDALVRELHERSSAVGRHPLGLDDVKGRARGIQRRRRAGAGAVAAVVLAIAVPVGLNVTGSNQSQPPLPADTPSQTPSPSPGPTPRKDGSFPLTLQGLARGDVPQVNYIVPRTGTLMTPEGPVEMDSSHGMVTPYGDGWIAVGDNKSASDVFFLDADFRVQDRVEGASNELRVNADRTRVAWTERVKGGAQIVVAPTDGGEPARTFVDLPVGPSLELVGFLDDDRVAFLDHDYVPFVAGPDGIEELDLQRVDATSDTTGVLAGLISYDTVDGGCFAARADGVQENLWETCDYWPQEFSPDGRFVVAAPNEFDGPGPSSFHLLDASTGESLLDLSRDRQSRKWLSVTQVTFEDDDTLLAIVTEQGDQAMVRIELDGTVTQVSDTEQVNMSVASWFAETPR